MDYILEFYNGLDTINLIIFWGVIIVVLLLLIFSIIMVNKNRKLEKIIAASGVDIYGDIPDDSLAIKKQTDIDIVKEKTTHTEVKNIDDDQNNPLDDLPIKENHMEKETIETPITTPVIPISEPPKASKFIAEEHVKEYNDTFFEIPTIKKQNDTKEIIHNYSESPTLKENIKTESMPRMNSPQAAYQKNVLKEAYPAQTSPIGNISKNVSTTTDEAKNIELNTPSSYQNHIDNERLATVNTTSTINTANTYRLAKTYHQDNSQPSDNTNKNRPSMPTYEQPVKKGNYLEELSKKMAQNNIDRTAYELQQEEDAIISYQELLAKKDKIHIVDEEDVVISIEELRRRKLEENKLYNITEREPNDSFIDELKNFRSDL